MADKSEDAAEPAAVAVETSTLRQQLAAVKQALANSPVRMTLVWSGVGILAVIVATSLGQILLNRWNQPFYDALQRRDMTDFLHQLVVFAEIAGGLLVLNIGQQWLNQRLHVKLREALTSDLIGEWMKPNRAFRLANAGVIGVNPDQRMQQDAGHLADLSIDLGVGLLQAFILLVSFIGVLWTLSSGFVFHFGATSIAIPGYMVWAAILYAGTASWLSWLVGRPLIQLNSERYAREAELRFAMVRVNENVDAIALARGEPDERGRLESALASVLAAVQRLYHTQINLAWVTDTYGWITVVAPILVASPVYFAGDISFGGLMMAVGAFNQVHSSLRWFINNIGGVADWRATLMRVADFRRALSDTDILHGQEKRIEIAENKSGDMTFDALEIASPGGRTKLARRRVVIHSGDHVLITGDPGAGKTLFFRAVAGLWPWGSGRIGLPAGEAPVLIPRTPYFSPGTLREVLCYPMGTTAHEDEELAAALAEVGLDRLTHSLDRTARWERELNDDEQRLLAFARLALQKPGLVIIDEALDTFDANTLKRVMAMFKTHMPEATILNIGRPQRGDRFFSKVLNIVKDVEGQALKPVRVASGALEPPPPPRPKK